MHKQRPETGHPTVSAMRRLSDDSSAYLTIRPCATLRLMISECRGAIHRPRGLIALARPDGRDTAGRTDRLRELEDIQDHLVACSNT